MRKALLWLGFLLSGAGVAAVVASAVMSYAGISASYNLGDPTKFEFILIPLWQIGVVVGLAGGVCLWASRRMKSVA